MASSSDFDKALAVGRPPNICKLFPHSKALIVSGKYIDLALQAKGKALQAKGNEGQIHNLTVTAVHDSSITVDGNHPLAGQALNFDIELVEIAEQA